VIICDFIDLRTSAHRRELEQRLARPPQARPRKTKMLRMSQFGIIEMTRAAHCAQLQALGLLRLPHCKGAGLVKTPESMSLDVMRRLAIAANDLKVARVELSVCPDVSFYLLNKKRMQLSGLEEDTKKKIVIRTDATLGLDEMKLDLFDSRDGVVILEELGMVLSPPPHVTQLGKRGGRGGRFDDRRQRGGRDQQRSGRGRDQKAGRGDRDAEDRFELDDAEDALEAREERIERGVAAAAEMGLAPTIVGDEVAGEEEQREGEPRRGSTAD
jgi:ribonuclease E